MARTPSHVKENILPDETASCINGTWYLCRETSVRIPDHKNPVKQKIQKAISYPGRRVELNSCTVLAQTNCTCYEFGFSYAAYLLCPEKWRKLLKDDWEAVLIHIIQNTSPESFLQRLPEAKIPDHYNLRLQEERFWKSFSPEDVTLMNKLRTVYVIYSPETNQYQLTKLSDAHNEATKGLGISLKECNLL